MTTLFPAPEILAVLCAAVFVAAVLRGLTGFGFALAAVPLMSLVVEPARAVVMAIVLQLLVGVRDLITLHGMLDRPSLVRMSAGAVLGTPAGVALLLVLDPAVMRLAIALVVFAGLAFLLKAPQKPAADRLTLALPMGIVAGAFAGLAAMPGPPAVAYFLGVDRPAAVKRASLMIFFFATSVIAIPLLLAGGEVDGGITLASLVALPVLVAGTAVGTWLFRRTSEAGYRNLAIATLAVMALMSGLRGLAGLL